MDGGARLMEAAPRTPTQVRWYTSLRCAEAFAIGDGGHGRCVRLVTVVMSPRNARGTPGVGMMTPLKGSSSGACEDWGASFWCRPRTYRRAIDGRGAWCYVDFPLPSECVAPSVMLLAARAFFLFYLEGL